MLSDKDLRELLDFTAPEPVLSLYLNTDPVDGNADAYRLRLRTLLKEVDLPEDEQAIEHYFDREHEWKGRSVAVFSCAAQNYFKAFPLAVPIQDRVHVDNRPTVKPLVDLLDAYGGYGVVLVDKQGARLFSVHMGEMKGQEGVLGEEVKHTKRGGASAVPGRRGGIAGQTNYEDELVERNMRETVEFAVHFFDENHSRRILIGGTDDNVALFRGMLPKAWQSLVMGTFPLAMTATNPEVLAKALEIGCEAEQDREKHLVQTVITNAAKGGAGSIGLDDTLRAVHDGRVQTLLVSDGYHESGRQCKGCGFITTQAVDPCPFCGESFARIPDAVEMAVRDVLRGSGEVEIIRNTAELDAAGRIGAILRY
jgi:peptide chain release factor subunit 1